MNSRRFIANPRSSQPERTQFFGTGPSGRMSEVGPGRVKTLTLNLRVEFLSRFRRCGNQLHWRLLLESNRENNSARPWLKRVFTQPGSIATEMGSPREVRLSPKSGAIADITPLPKSANNGHACCRVAGF